MIWVIAGTKSARDLIDILLKHNFSIIASTTTDYGSSLFHKNHNLIVVAQSMDKEAMIDFIKRYSINLIIDASHPYAVQVSNNAISASFQESIPYIRYERKSINCHNSRIFNTYDKAAEYLYEQNGNIFLTIGSKNLDVFSNISKERVYVRIYPFMDSIEKCEKAGFLPDRIIAMKPPFSKDFNKALYKELNIKFLVTKESGDDGGVNEKINAALEMNIEVIVIKRPDIAYPHIIYDSVKIVDQAEQIFKRINTEMN